MLNAQSDQYNRKTGAFVKKLLDFSYSWAEIARQLSAKGFTTHNGEAFKTCRCNEWLNGLNRYTKI